LCSTHRLSNDGNCCSLFGQANDSAFARRCYQANILFIDEWVGKILDTLTTTAQLENTCVWSHSHAAIQPIIVLHEENVTHEGMPLGLQVHRLGR
jgi:hypothetical protein